MGYCMDYKRVLNRNGLHGDYNGQHAGLILGDLRRLEKDQRDELHLASYARRAGITKEQAKAVLDALFGDGEDCVHFHPSLEDKPGRNHS